MSHPLSHNGSVKEVGEFGLRELGSWNCQFFTPFWFNMTHCVAAAGWEALDTNYREKGFMVDLPLLDGCKKIFDDIH